MTISRRDFLKITAASGTAGIFYGMLPGIALATDGDNASSGSDILINVFQRGAADGLNMIVPYGDPDYYANRPSLAIAKPDSGNPDAALMLDGFFGLHPAMSALLPIFQAGGLAMVHATGSLDSTHSHFESQVFVDRGFIGISEVNDGWVGRYLQNAVTDQQSVFRGLAMGNSVQISLRGEISAVAMQNIASFDLQAPDSESNLIKTQLNTLFSHGSILDATSNTTLAAIEQLKTANPQQFTEENGAVYPDTVFGQQMKEIGQMIKADMGVQVACVDLGGWDTHEGQAATMATLAAEFADSLAAFHTDMGTRMNNITLVSLTEFGRRLEENASGGTDHGRGNVAFFMGGGVNGGQVYANWPGLNQEALSGPGDLMPTVDYRTLISEMSEKRLAVNPAHLFPDFQPEPYLGLFRTRTG